MTSPSWEDGRPPELEAVRRDDALLDALSAQRAAPVDDEVGALLGALVADVNSEPVDLPQPIPVSGRRGRRLPRTFVALSVTTVVLASTGVAAAAGGLGPFTSGSAEPREAINHPHVVDGTSAPPTHPATVRRGQLSDGGGPTGRTGSSAAGSPSRTQPTTPTPTPAATDGSQTSKTPTQQPTTSPTATPTGPVNKPNLGGPPSTPPGKKPHTAPTPTTGTPTPRGKDLHARVRLEIIRKYGLK